MFGDVGHARTKAAMLLLMIATTLSRTCTKPTVVRIQMDGHRVLSVCFKTPYFCKFFLICSVDVTKIIAIPSFSAP